MRHRSDIDTDDRSSTAPVRRTVSETWRRAVEDPPDRPAFLVHARPGWREVTWDEARRAVEELAAGFLSLGVVKGDRVAILCRTRLEWILCDQALICIGAVVVPTYPSASASDCLHVLSDSGARIAVCEDESQYAKIGRARGELRALEQVVAIEPFPGADRSLDEVRGAGRRYLDENPGGVDAARSAITEGDLLTCVYTSGTTGPPKGCMLTHLNYWEMVEMVCRVPGLVEPGDRTVLHLPLAHVFARLVELTGPRRGLTIALCPETATLPGALRAVRPTIFPSVPRVFEGVARTVAARVARAAGGRRLIADWALAVGREASRRRRAGERLGARLALRHAVADRLVLSTVRRGLGGSLRVVISGGAPLGHEVAEFLHALGVPVLEGYGLTECTTVATLNTPDRFRLGTVGPPLPGVEVRIADDGEILVRGENVFAGYWGDEEATRAVVSADGWLSTGDVGSIDADGFLTITDRKKDLIVTPGGKNVSPQNIEGALRASRYVANALVVGDRRPYLVALVTLDRDAAGADATGEEEAEALIGTVVADVNRRLSPPEQVRRFAVLARDFLAEEGEVTPTLKLRRRVCEQHFQDEIERMYPGPRDTGAPDA